MTWHLIAILAVGLGLLAVALQPWLTRVIVRLAARIDADHPNEVDDLYAEYVAGIDALPGRLWGLPTACGLLFKVAIARRVRDRRLAFRCATHLRVGLIRDAIARRRAMPRARASVLPPATTADPAAQAPNSTVEVDLVMLRGLASALTAIEDFYNKPTTRKADSDDRDGHRKPAPPQSDNPADE